MIKIPIIIATVLTIVCPHCPTPTFLGILAEPHQSVEDGEREGDILFAVPAPEAYFCFRAASFARSEIVKF